MTEAVLLVGGKGTRLRPLTVNTPKPMLPTAGVPFLHHVLSKARAAGIDHVVLATSYRPEVFRDGIGDGVGARAAGRLRHRGRADGDRRRHPQRRGPARERAGRPGRHPQRRHPVRPRPGEADRGPPGQRRGGDAAPHRGRGRAAVRLRAVRRRRPGDRVPGEDGAAGHQPDQRRLLRVPARGDRRDPGGPAGVGRAGDVPRPGRVGGAGPRARRPGVLARPRDAGRLRARLPRPGARRPRVARRCPARSASRSGWPAPRSPTTRWSAAGRRSVPGRRSGPARRSRAACCSTTPWWVPARRSATRSSAVARGSATACVLDGVVVGDGADVGEGNELAAGARVWVDARIPPYAIRFTPDVAPADRRGTTRGGRAYGRLARRRSARASRWTGTRR